MNFFFKLIGCCEENVLDNIHDEVYTLHRPVVSKSKKFGFSSSPFYHGWLKAIQTGYPVIVTPKCESERLVLRGEVKNFNSRIKDLILTSDSHMKEVPLVAEIRIGYCFVFAIVAPEYFSKGESDRYYDLQKLSHVLI